MSAKPIGPWVAVEPLLRERAGALHLPWMRVTDDTYAAFVLAIDPVVNVMCNGPTKGGDAGVIRTLREAKSFLSGRSQAIRSELGGMMEEASNKLDFETAARIRDRIAANQLLCEIEGNGRALLTAERSALNFLQLLSAVASKVRIYADAIAGTKKNAFNDPCQFITVHCSPPPCEFENQ